MADYKVVVSSSAVKVEVNEEWSSISAIWLGDVDMILLLDCAICHMTGYLLSLCCHRPVLPAFVDMSHIQVS